MMMQILRQACNERGIRILVHTKAEKILTDVNSEPNLWRPRLVAN